MIKKLLLQQCITELSSYIKRFKKVKMEYLLRCIFEYCFICTSGISANYQLHYLVNT